MPSTDYQGSSAPLTAIGRSLFSLRRDAMDPRPDAAGGGGGHGLDLDAFQKQVFDQFHGLAGADDELLSLPWLGRLLDAFVCCQEEFRAILFGSRPAAAARPPLDRLVGEYFDRSVKALDVCNAIRDGLEQMRLWRRHLEIVACALGGGDPRPRALGEGQLRRARKALTDLTIAMLDDKDASRVLAHRNRSFGCHGSSSKDPRAGHFRSFSWSVSRNWSAAKQLQAIGVNIAPPRSSEVAATNGLAIPVFTMNSVLLFVMWAMVAAIPCQDRGLQAHFSIPRHFSWAHSVQSMHDRIMEESKKRERKGSCGLLKEIFEIEKCVRRMTELADSVQFPLSEEKVEEVRKAVEELGELLGRLKDGLDPLERQVREVFHRIVRSRTECLDCLGHTD